MISYKDFAGNEVTAEQFTKTNTPRAIKSVSTDAKLGRTDAGDIALWGDWIVYEEGQSPRIVSDSIFSNLYSNKLSRT